MSSYDSIFTAMVNTYTEQLYWHIRRLVVSHEDAQDVLQETFMKAYRKLWTLRDRSAARAWLYRIATNEAMRQLGRRKEQEQLSAELMERIADERYINLEDIAGIRLQKAIARLSPMQRTVFCLKYFDDMDYEEISYITGTKTDALKANWHLAKKNVEQYIKQYE